MIVLDDKDLDAIASVRANRNKKLNIIFGVLGTILVIFLASSLFAAEIGVCYNIPTLIGFIAATFILCLWYMIHISVNKRKILKQLKEETSASIHKS